jgi:hypothetical protein
MNTFRVGRSNREHTCLLLHFLECGGVEKEVELGFNFNLSHARDVFLALRLALR